MDMDASEERLWTFQSVITRKPIPVSCNVRSSFLFSGKLEGHFNTMALQYLLPEPVIDL